MVTSHRNPKIRDATRQGASAAESNTLMLVQHVQSVQSFKTHWFVYNRESTGHSVQRNSAWNTVEYLSVYLMQKGALSVEIVQEINCNGRCDPVRRVRFREMLQTAQAEGRQVLVLNANRILRPEVYRREANPFKVPTGREWGVVDEWIGSAKVYSVVDPGLPEEVQVSQVQMLNHEELPLHGRAPLGPRCRKKSEKIGAYLMHKMNERPVEISKRLNVPQRTIERWIKEFKHLSPPGPTPPVLPSTLQSYLQ